MNGSYLLSSADSVDFRGEITTFISVEYDILKLFTPIRCVEP